MGYLITGSKGFIGRNLTTFMDDSFVSYEKIENYNSVPDTLIHLSANTNVRRSIKRPKINFDKNTKQTFDLLNHAVKLGVKNFIFASSMGVTEPCSPYLASKVSGEAYCKAFKSSYGINTHIARFSNVYGPCSEYKDSIIPKFIKTIMADDTFYIYGNGLQTRDFIYVDDVVKALLNTSDYISYITSGTTITINNLIRKLILLSMELLDCVPRIENIHGLPGEISKVAKTEGISNPTSLDIGLRKTFKWFLKHQ